MSGEYKAVVQRTLDATVQEVYDAWTTPEILAEWITEGGRVVKADVRVGGEFLIDMGCGGGKTAPHGGMYRVLDRPHVIEYTWISDWTKGESVVRIELTPVDGKTNFMLVHTGLPDQANADDHQEGWTDLANKAVASAIKRRKT
jgi:uncharacterized protein YndB with AHSA1/START domain